MESRLTVILPDIRSAQNVGAILRTADAVGAAVVTCGITPYPIHPGDDRPGHVADQAHKLISKTALGAEKTVSHLHIPQLAAAISKLRGQGYLILALEQDARSVDLFRFYSDRPVALVLGPEVNGLDRVDLDACDKILEIPMRGSKESLNVSVAAGIAMYHLIQPSDWLPKLP